jgi:hypothetical protein
VFFLFYALFFFESYTTDTIPDYNEFTDPNNSTEYTTDHNGFSGFYGFSYVTVLTCLFIFNSYTLTIEVRQMVSSGYNYVQSIWNILDCITILISPTIIIMDFANVRDELLRPLISICVLLFFIRFFYFLRIFESSTKIVRIIIEITYDIKIFILVLFMGVAGFGFSFYILSNNNEVPFIDSLPESFTYSYSIIIG